MQKVIIRFGLLAAALLGLIQLSKYSYFSSGISGEIVFSIFAVVFLVFGVILSRQIFKPKPIIQIQKPLNSPDMNRVESLGITKREYEVLQLIAKGHSNKDIADQLFVSESTIKTHVSNLFVKLDARRRTQAVTHAKEMNILV